MATSSVSKRSIRLPNTGSPTVVAVQADIIAKCKSLASSPVLIYLSQDGSVMNLEFQLSSVNDTTLQTSMAGWASRLGIAQLDTDVSTFTAGHA